MSKLARGDKMTSSVDSRRKSTSSRRSSSSPFTSDTDSRKKVSANLDMENGRVATAGKIQHLTKSTCERSRFPKLEDCAHFHYEHVELACLRVSLVEEEDSKTAISTSQESIECGGGGNSSTSTKWFTVKVESQGSSWLLRRSYENFRTLDQQLHQCIYDRKFSSLSELKPIDSFDQKEDLQQNVRLILRRYCEIFSNIAGSLINCGPVLSWFQLDNRGYRILVPEGDSCPINTPAVGAAYAITKYEAVAVDEISFDVGEMISVIDMPPPEESVWWRGKRGFLVGFFPSQCVALITDKVPRHLHLNQLNTSVEPTKPVLRKHGKLISFFRAFILARPSRRHLKQSGILKERVFGCDLGEHLLNSGHDIPTVLKCSSEFIEKYGIVDGIYRLSGVTSNIQKLRTTFDEDKIPSLYTDTVVVQDIHSVASLLKMYFRELPNPLCTYQLYNNFVAAVQHPDPLQKLFLMKETVQKLPPPHFRTLEYLMKHLAKVAEFGTRTGMTARNIAIVWAPNLLRCKELEVGGVAALQGVGVQAVVTEFLISNVNEVFFPTEAQLSTAALQATPKRARPKSLSLNANRLLSLEEAQNKKFGIDPQSDYIEVGGGPACLPKKYHTVIELPSRKRSALKRSPLGWKSLFSRSGSAGPNIRKSISNHRVDAQSRSSATESQQVESGNLDFESHRQLRTVKSAESLTTSSSNSASSVRNSSTVEASLVAPTCSSICPSPKLNVPCSSHSRTVSHESYFDILDENTAVHSAPDEDLSDLQAHFDMEESEMKIFSDEETTQMFSNGSSLEHLHLQDGKPSVRLASAENTIAIEASPKKHKSGAEDSDSCSGSFTSIPDDTIITASNKKRSRLEDDISYIDSVQPDQLVPKMESFATIAEVHNENGSAQSSPVSDSTTSNTDYDLTAHNAYTPLSEEPFSALSSLPENHNNIVPLLSDSWIVQPTEQLYENVPHNRYSYQERSNIIYENVDADKYSADIRKALSEYSLYLWNKSRNSVADGYEFVINNNSSSRKSKIRQSKYETIGKNIKISAKDSKNYVVKSDNNKENENYGDYELVSPVDDEMISANSVASERGDDSPFYVSSCTDSSPEECLVDNNLYDRLATEDSSPDATDIFGNGKKCSSKPYSLNINEIRSYENVSPSKTVFNIVNVTQPLISSPYTDEDSCSPVSALHPLSIPRPSLSYSSVSQNAVSQNAVSHTDKCQPVRPNTLVLASTTSSGPKTAVVTENEKGKWNKGIGIATPDKPADSENAWSIQQLKSCFETPPCKQQVECRVNSEEGKKCAKQPSMSHSTSLDNIKTIPASPHLTKVQTSSEVFSDDVPINKEIDEEAIRRERIEKYKEERRLMLREKYRIEDNEEDESTIKRIREKFQKIPSEDHLMKTVSTNHAIKTINTANIRLEEKKSPANVTTINILYSPRRNDSFQSSEYSKPIIIDIGNADSQTRYARGETNKRDLYTCSLERKKLSHQQIARNGNKMDGIVAQRVNQLSVATEQIFPSRKYSAIDRPPIERCLRQRAHSTSSPIMPHCIRDIAAIFEAKDVK